MITPINFDCSQIKPLQAVLFLAYESIYGLAIGLMVLILFSVIKISGQIIEVEMGLTMGSVFDPTTGEENQPFGILMETLFILIFLSMDGHHLFLMVISRSFEAFPAGTIPTLATLVDGIVQSFTVMFITALRLAAPLLAISMMLLVALAVLARVVPEMDILFISMTLRVSVGLLMATTFLPFIKEYVTEFSQWMNKLLPI
jgi:flagellar biosynthetic protein FliR